MVAQTPVPMALINRQVVDATGDWDTFVDHLVKAIDASTASLHMQKVQPKVAPQPTAVPAPVPVRAPRRAFPVAPVLILVSLAACIVITFVGTTLISSNQAGDMRATASTSAILSTGQAGLDTDRDGLTDSHELELRLDPANPDTDGDGLTDGDEVRRYGTNPANRD
ncbi:MAG: thrombospondin type 3 repeat-containing protein, partial [Anaerolineae bacterium]|nr:thrombospondin type 3 repeat-containing protein [Anaerolineae bacterium]